MYFGKEQLKTEKDLVPQNFKPLNDFVVMRVKPEDAKNRPYVFRVYFHKDALQIKNMSL